jgi:hypothetical protein
MVEELLQATTAHYYIDVSYLVLKHCTVKRFSSFSIRLWLSCNVNCTAVLAIKGKTERWQPLLENLGWSKPCDDSEMFSFPSYDVSDGLDSGIKSISELLSLRISAISSSLCVPWLLKQKPQKQRNWILCTRDQVWPHTAIISQMWVASLYQVH